MTPPILIAEDKGNRITSIEVLRELLAGWLHIPEEDRDLIDFCLAVYKSNEIPGDPLWGIIIDASGGGKTELLRTLRHRKDAYFLSKMSEKTLVSGYRDPGNPKKDPSILPELNGKVLVIKDLAPLLSMRSESRNAVIADLRDAYDGFTDQGRGNLGRVCYESRFTLLSASTLAIERTSAVDQDLGERFIKIRARGDGSREKVRKAISNIGCDDRMRPEIEKAISEFLDSLPSIAAASIPEDLQEDLVRIADVTAKARSAVARDRDGTIQYAPRPEVGTRLGKALGKLPLALAAVRRKPRPDRDDLAMIGRVAEDCLHPNRWAVIQALSKSTGPLRPGELENLTGIKHTTLARTLDDLQILGLVRPTDEALIDTRGWSLSEPWPTG